ncbi:hypothetical protein GQ600_9071 [Phytophthora cactorum]|nr:hypothetical protein GQ600_1260 [Phytophthora cactorum]KAF1777884.1 hypothetical protein GQ600_26847 [Phytophthora cactorum]KAF1787131.1 hypothetical protein GQ600_9071 [Phytophthora cactorum]
MSLSGFSFGSCGYNTHPEKLTAGDQSLNVGGPDLRALRDHRPENGINEERRFTSTAMTVKSLFLRKMADKSLQRLVANNLSPEDVFVWLKLNKAENQHFQKRAFITWASYMAKINPKNTKSAILSTLKTRYSDLALSQMIIAAKKAEVFNLFNLNNDARKLDDFVDNSKFAIWVKYVADINGKDPAKSNAIVAQTLTSYYTNRRPYNMLDTAKNVKSTETLDTKILQGQFDNWLASKTLVHHVNGWLGPEKTSAERKIVRDYLNAYNKMYPL